MSNESFIALVSWVIAHGYFLFFLSAIIEGPLVTAAAGVAAALGYFSLPAIIMIAVAGDLIADVVAYSIGYFGGRPLAERYGHSVGLTAERIQKWERVIHAHLGKMIVFFKLSPIIPVPGLMLIGSLRADPRRFIKVSLLVSFPKAIFFALFGFFSGKAYQYLSGTIISVRNASFVIGFLVIVIYLIYRKVSGRLAREMEE